MLFQACFELPADPGLPDLGACEWISTATLGAGDLAIDFELVQWAFGAGLAVWATGLGVGILISLIRKARH